jgi:MoaA/NifB/PqqE/SkfB family radical SAM enzyme
MCPWKEFRGRIENQAVMRPEVWDAIRLHLRDILTVDFTGGGEPLLQPFLPQWVADGKAAGCQTGILTNGLVLHKETAQELIAAGLDWICVSMDGADKDQYERIRIGSSFERVCENLADVARLRVAGVPKTMINFVMMSSNFHQVEDMVTLAARLGVDQVNFKQCDVIRGEQGKGYGLFGREESREIRRMRKALSRALKLARKVGVKTTAAPFTPNERPVCEQDPRDSMFVRYDGTVAPCISLAIGGPTTFLGKDAVMPSVHYGRLLERDLLELWETEPCRLHRQSFHERVRAYENTFVEGLMTDSLRTPQRLREAAVKRMPTAPEGCRVCHYLFDV